MKSLREYLPHMPAGFIDEMEENGVLKTIEANTEVLREGQYVKFIPLVLEGSLKVFTSHADKELLLYYIESGESCIMSFSAAMKNSPSKIFAITEQDSLLLLMPVEKLDHWVKTFSSVNDLFYKLYDQRYASLLETIQHLLYNKLDQRLLGYLQEKSRQKNSRILNLRHKQIAAELGTVREVISRVMKKLEHEGKLKQLPGGIEIL